MIEITSDNMKVKCKIAGNMSQLLNDTRNICSSLACTLLECAEPDTELAVLCCIQSIFSDCVTDALHQTVNKSENDQFNKIENGVSTIKIDMEALKDYLKNKDDYDEPEEDNNK